jgi:hypothetical protein
MELGAIGELVGGVAVIASLVYVGLQVRQNNQGLKEASNRELAIQNDRILDVLLTEPEARKIWATATENAITNTMKNPAKLDEDGLNYWFLLMYRVFNNYHSIYHTWRAGALDDVHWTKIQAIIAFYLATPMGRDFWHSSREGWWDAEFIEHIDQMEAAATSR